MPSRRQRRQTGSVNGPSYFSLLDDRFTGLASPFVPVEIQFRAGLVVEYLLASKTSSLAANNRLIATTFLYSSPLRRTATVVRNGSGVLNVANFDASRGQGANRRFAAGTGTADAHFDAAHTVIARHVGGVLAACWAANGVPLRDPRKPSEPELFQARTLPAWSAMVTMVLLNEAWMWAMPCGTCFRSFFLKVFFLPFFSGVAAGPRCRCWCCWFCHS